MKVSHPGAAHPPGHQFAIDDFKPPRDRRVLVRAVPCPECKVGVGEQCRTLDGKPRAVCHRCRRRMAIRHENEAKQ